MGLEKGLGSQEQALVLLLQRVDSVPCTRVGQLTAAGNSSPRDPNTLFWHRHYANMYEITNIIKNKISLKAFENKYIF